jgi:hypothetical protein
VNDETLDQLADLLLERIMAKMSLAGDTVPAATETEPLDFSGEQGEVPVAERPAWASRPIERPEPIQVQSTGPSPIGQTPQYVEVGRSANGYIFDDARIAREFERNWFGEFRRAGLNPNRPLPPGFGNTFANIDIGGEE